MSKKQSEHMTELYFVTFDSTRELADGHGEVTPLDKLADGDYGVHQSFYCVVDAEDEDNAAAKAIILCSKAIRQVLENK